MDGMHDTCFSKDFKCDKLDLSKWLIDYLPAGYRKPVYCPLYPLPNR